VLESPAPQLWRQERQLQESQPEARRAAERCGDKHRGLREWWTRPPEVLPQRLQQAAQLRRQAAAQLRLLPVPWPQQGQRADDWQLPAAAVRRRFAVRSAAEEQSCAVLDEQEAVAWLPLPEQPAAPGTAPTAGVRPLA